MELRTVDSLPQGAIPVDSGEGGLRTVDTLPKGAVPVDAPAGEDDFEHEFSALNMAMNIPGSIGGVLSDTYQMLRHPVETVQALYGMGISGLKDAVLERYGSWDRFQKTLEEDPAGVALDLSFFANPAAGGVRAAATAGGRAAARAGSQAGVAAAQAGRKAAGVAQKGARILEASDPANIAVKGAGIVGKGAYKTLDEMLGTSTQAGSAAMVLAREAGMEGGKAQEAFRRGQKSQGLIDRAPDAPDAVKQGQLAVKEMGAEAYSAYDVGMRKHLENPTPVDPASIADLINNAAFERRKRGPASVGGRAAPAKAVEDALNDDIMPLYQRFLDNGNYTLSGIDVLRADLDQLAKTKYKGDKMVGGLVNKITSELRDKADAISPGYIDELVQYKKAAETIGEIERALNLGARNSTDTAMRKLQQALRTHTAQGNFGYRKQLLDMLAEKQPGLMYELAGQTLSPGLRSAFFTQTGMATGGLAWYMGNPAVLLLMFSFSPKTVGKAQNIAGIAKRPFYKASRAVHNMIEKSGVGAVDPRRISLARRGTQEAGTLVADLKEFYTEEEKEKMRSWINSRNKDGVSQKMIDRILDQLSSTNPRDVEKALNTLARNDRVRKLFGSDE